VPALWKLVGLPQLPESFCHVGLKGWHCHNTTHHPWSPDSILPPAKTPAMPANASCIVCPEGWTGKRAELVGALLDLPAAMEQAKAMAAAIAKLDAKPPAVAAAAASPKPAAARASSPVPKPAALKPVAVPKPAAAKPVAAAVGGTFGH
jgi:hypothetical protein